MSVVNRSITATDVYDFFFGLAERIRSHRRFLHRIPELGFSETKTSTYICNTLDSMGIEYTSGIGGTGVVAKIGFGKIGIGIRADMDALAIVEEGDMKYKSTHEGLMHACGHDAHTAMLLGVAEFFKSYEAMVSARVYLVFQPSEERSDGKGRSGARHILDSGLLDGVSAMLAIHVGSQEPAGRFGIISGPITASGDMFKASIYGRGGHDAFVNQTIDPIYLATQVLSAIYSIRSRRIDPNLGGTLSVGTISAGTTANVIPEKLDISGTIRTFDPNVREIFLEELKKALRIAETLGGRWELEVPVSIPETNNDELLASIVRETCLELFGEEGLFPLKPMVAVEDFAWYSRRVPSLLIILGARIDDGVARPFHNPRFDIDDGILFRGSSLLALAALRIAKIQENSQIAEKGEF